MRSHYQGLGEWYQHKVGETLFTLEKNELAQQLVFVPGQHILQIGAVPELIAHARQHLCFHYFLDEIENKQARYAIRASFDELPLLPNSLNKIVIAHALEFCEHPSLLLRDCYEALVPGGQLIIICFNFYSLWTLKKLFKANREQMPWLGKFFSLTELKKNLNMLHYAVKLDKTFCFRFPDKASRSAAWLRFVEAFGQMVLTNFGAVNLVVAEKQMMAPLTQTTADRLMRKIKNATWVAPTTRRKSNE